MERIDDFFEKRLSKKEQEQFESDLNSDPELMQSVAFFLAAKRAAAAEAQSQQLTNRHEEWRRSGRATADRPVMRMWYMAAAAVVILTIGLIWYQLFVQTQDLKQMAATYSETNFATLNIAMGTSDDSLKLATAFYNKGEYKIAASVCDSILKYDPKNAGAKRIAGIVSLRLHDYDKAITYFHELGQQEYLQDNPGKFYEAIALIQRDLPLDKKKAKNLLQEVINGNLEGKEQAQQWLNQ